ncbi:serpin family protein [Paenarthrobacter nitroguajacolicus]|uniref:serpin family protein n=1 Tax=Paenarthrobacter nitroguajacolicus TaxID=211146 RepID=UPI0015C19F8E|nr:serpin family protein [Paenarthrobacter nitroguajacolicus]NWL34593.1 proteinase inhibitor I4 serpin [Paenarthrobacter nitroguajacolicus]
MKRTGRVTALLAAAALVSGSATITACAPQPTDVGLQTADGVTRVSVQTTDYSAQLAAFNASARKLGATLLADGGDSDNGNVVSSPASLLIALSMLRAGASGATAAEMDSALGFPGEGRDETMNALLASLEKFDGDPGSVDEENPPRKPVMHAANGLFTDKGVPTGEAFLATLAKHFGTGVYPVNFRDEAVTKPAIDQWVSRNTGGRIKEAPAQYDPDNTFSLLNALYFAAAWQTPFDADDTSDGPFTKGNGEVINVPMMHSSLTMAYAEGPGWQAADLPYAEGFVMRLVLPDGDAPGSGGSSGAAGQAAASAAVLADVAKGLGAAKQGMVQISLPKWDHKTTFELRKVFKTLGLNQMLATDKDFDAIQQGMKLTQAAQAANITVAEKGTIASAVTQMNAEASSAVVPEREIVLDHPFHYQIVHVGTGMPLFMGWVADPRS